MPNSTKQDDKISITIMIIFKSSFLVSEKKKPNLLPVSYNGSPKYDSFKRLEEQKTMLKSLYRSLRNANRRTAASVIIGNSWGSFLTDLQNLDVKKEAAKIATR